jgi:hypothetical protein
MRKKCDVSADVKGIRRHFPKHLTVQPLDTRYSYDRLYPGSIHLLRVFASKTNSAQIFYDFLVTKLRLAPPSAVDTHAVGETRG